MNRTEAFENMLQDIFEKYNYEKEMMDKLKAEGKEKTATYRQYMGNRLMYTHMLALYKEYGLID